MAVESKGAPGLNYSEFLRRLKAGRFSDAQTGPLGLRLQLLEAFMQQAHPPGSSKACDTRHMGIRKRHPHYRRS